MRILVCGGAGYIGSHAVLALLEKGFEVVVVDNLVKGHKKAVPKGVKLIEGDLCEYSFIEKVFKENRIDAVIDFAAFSLVGESVAEPLKYYENNVYSTMNLLKAMRAAEVKNIVFSSTAAVYGEPEEIPITENSKNLPKNPYGETKLAVEKMLRWADEAHGIKYAVLRYFNVAGAHESGKIGEDHRPETHLIPNVLRAAREKIPLIIYGNDYPTADKTCIRDYIHVMDLVEAHILALMKSVNEKVSLTYNLGNGSGFSNLSILNAAREVTGIDIEFSYAERRPGDPAVLVASSQKIQKELGWQPKYTDIKSIIETAWNWHKNNPRGFEN